MTWTLSILCRFEQLTFKADKFWPSSCIDISKWLLYLIIYFWLCFLLSYMSLNTKDGCLTSKWLVFILVVCDLDFQHSLPFWTINDQSWHILTVFVHWYLQMTFIFDHILLAVPSSILCEPKTKRWLSKIKEIRVYFGGMWPGLWAFFVVLNNQQSKPTKFWPTLYIDISKWLLYLIIYFWLCFLVSYMSRNPKDGCLTSKWSVFILVVCDLDVEHSFQFWTINDQSWQILTVFVHWYIQMTFIFDDILLAVPPSILYEPKTKRWLSNIKDISVNFGGIWSGLWAFFAVLNN